MKDNNTYEEKYLEDRDAAFLEKCKEEFTVKPFHLQYKTAYLAMQPIRAIFQLISAATACAAAAYFTYAFIGSVWIGLAVGGVLMVLIELLKQNAWGLFWRNFLQFGRGSTIALGFAVITILISGALSFLGAPKFVEQFSPAAALIDIDVIKGSDKRAQDSIKQHFANVADTLEASANLIHEQNNWKGTTARSARSQVISLREAAAAARGDSMHVAVNAAAARAMHSIKEAKASNATAKRERAERVALIGGFVGLLAILAELIVCFAVWWSIYYRYRASKHIQDNMRRNKDVNDSVRNIQPVNKVAPVRPKEVIKIVHKEKADTVASVERKKNLTKNAPEEGGQIVRTCGNCGKEYKTDTHTKKYCSADCRADAYNKRRRKAKNIKTII